MSKLGPVYLLPQPHPHPPQVSQWTLHLSDLTSILNASRLHTKSRLPQNQKKAAPLIWITVESPGFYPVIL